MVNRSRLIFILVRLFFFPFSHLFSTEREPWIGNYFEFEWRTSLLYQQYKRIAVDSHIVPYSSKDYFVHLSLANAIKPNFSLELESTLAHTRQQDRRVDHFKLTGRYVLLDQLVGEPLTMTLGFSLQKGFKKALKDISSFHHGTEEGECFISLGKERGHGSLWDSRGWLMLGFGVANRGKPWLFFQGAYEQRLYKLHEGRFFIEGLWGRGEQSICPCHFKGYGSVHHQSMDLGLRYTYLIPYFGSISLEYVRRFYAYNFPTQTDRILLTILYTFGL